MRQQCVTSDNMSTLDFSNSLLSSSTRSLTRCCSPWRRSAARAPAARWTAAHGRARPLHPSRPPPPPPAPACTPPPAGPPLHIRSVVCSVRTLAACSSHLQQWQTSAAATNACVVFALLAAACPRPGACAKRMDTDHLLRQGHRHGKMPTRGQAAKRVLHAEPGQHRLRRRQLPPVRRHDGGHIWLRTAVAVIVSA
jgi:hypothetical protein